MSFNVPEIESKKIKSYRKIISLSFLLFLISLTQTAVITNPAESTPSSAFMSFLLGWLDLNGPGISWLANPFLFLSWFFLNNKKVKLSILSSLMSTGFSVSFLFFDKIALDEAVNYGKILGYGSGYWLWVTSCLVSFIGTVNFYLKYETSTNRA
ncbi:hypothetical protein KIH23_13410 [Flavobacterium sp. CYK-55]|uniref:hypothetical protein n=1 Tax=Flavobacterium sp. CYK-55 TaxID=2835529 RepID=UPI001BCEA18A|nr:hypothetical protein [Flavobacterium sp. CYK-55]MBS7788300.1 hypothetical protein [Flavobacterium sp. CYK-55]